MLLLQTQAWRIAEKQEARCCSEAIGSSTGPLPAATLVFLSHTYCYAPYTNLFLVAAATTTKLIFTSTISSSPTSFHQGWEVFLDSDYSRHNSVRWHHFSNAINLIERLYSSHVSVG